MLQQVWADGVSRQEALAHAQARQVDAGCLLLPSHAWDGPSSAQ
jgi:hypothetical protein